ncbi:MAG TPA: hypothetical protein VJQ44_11640 [Gemmatimonadales bacterium]|nr:hypothetical protein [Gemmatimonadales bacterium]
MARSVGLVFLVLAAVLLSLGIWDLPLIEGPSLPAAQGLLSEGPGWYLQAGYLALALLLAAIGGWLVARAGGSRPDDRG